jgi:ADP-ribose pyrophosphatase YjhB (NUDIX family)
MLLRNFKHCPQCASAYAYGAAPDTTTEQLVCKPCQFAVYANPVPVAVLIPWVNTPHAYGIYMIRRSVPGYGFGKLALPGGFVGPNETWQQAGVRELAEEAHVLGCDPEQVRQVAVHSTPDNTRILIFGTLLMDKKDVATFIPTDETSERVFVPLEWHGGDAFFYVQEKDVAFPLHYKELKEFGETFSEYQYS